MTQWCVMPPSPLPYQTLRQMEGRTPVLVAEGGWMEFCCLVTALLSIPPGLLSSGRGPHTRLTAIPVTRGWS